jgi:hypothetical protein
MAVEPQKPENGAVIPDIVVTPIGRSAILRWIVDGSPLLKRVGFSKDVTRQAESVPLHLSSCFADS